MRAFAPALLSLLIFTQVDSAVDHLTELRRNGASISFVIEFEVPDYTDEEGNEAENSPINIEAIVGAELESTTERTRPSTTDGESSSFLKNKILWNVEGRALDIDVKTENTQSGNVQASEGSPLETRIEHTATQGQVQPTDGAGGSTVLEAKHTEAVEKRIESTDFQTGDVQGRDAALARTENGHTATQKEVPATGDRRSNTFLVTKQPDVAQERLGSDILTERRQSGGDGALAQNKTEHTTQKEVPAAGDRRSNSFPQAKQIDVAQERLGSDIVTERRQGDDTPRSEAAQVHNDTEFTATQKQVLAAGDKTSAFLETEASVAGQNRTEGPDVKIEKRLGSEAQGNEEALASPFDDKGSGSSQVESARGIHNVLEDSKETESSGNSSRREATDSRKGNESAQSITTETVRHMVLEERQMAIDERQMTRGGNDASARDANEVFSERAKDLQEESKVTNASKSNGPEREKVLRERQMVLDERQTTEGGEASATREANEVFSERAKDLQEETKVTNTSKSNGPNREKETSMVSEATGRRSNQEMNNVSKDTLETAQAAAKLPVTSLQKEEVQRQAATATEESQLDRVGASRNVKDRTLAAEVSRVNFTEDSTSSREQKASVTGRFLASQGAGETEVDSSFEKPARLTLTMMDEKRELLRSDDSRPRGEEDNGSRTMTRPHASEGSAWEKDMYTDYT